MSFNSRTPGGVRPPPLKAPIYRLQFQFTHPGRGATAYQLWLYPFLKFQFTHPGRGATDIILPGLEVDEVSIHAPREGCDL